MSAISSLTSVTPEVLIAAIRANGNDATELRDAVHEAHHALESGTPRGRWDRETIHRHVTKMGRGRAAASEVMARAVEQIVCRRLGVVIDPIDKWSLISCMEAISHRIPFLDYEQMLAATKRALDSVAAQRAADAVMGLAFLPAPEAKKRGKR